MVVDNPSFYLFAIPAVLLTGISKGGFGGALGGIAVPLMALAVSPLQAAAIMLPVLCFMDLVGIRAYFGKWDRENLKIMIPGAFVGLGAGALSFGLFSENSIRLLIGGIAVLFVANNVLGLASRQHAAGRSPVKGVLWSAVSGFTSFVAHAGGPPLMVYLLPQRLEKARYVATVSIFFAIANAAKLLPYAWLEQFSAQNLLTSLVLAPLVPIGVWLGIWLQDRISQALFYRLAQAFLFISGLQLIYLGLRS